MILRGWFPMDGAARRTADGLLGLLLAIFAALAAMYLIDRDEQVSGLELSKNQQAAFANITATRHTIDRIEFFGWNADSGSAGIVIRGNRAGGYRITWQVTEASHGQILAEGVTTVTFGPGRRTVVIPLARDEIVEAYRDKVLKGAGGIRVDETFRLAATLEPVLSAEEITVLPPGEVRKLANGRSALRSDVGVDLPMSFQVPDDPAVQTD